MELSIGKKWLPKKWQNILLMVLASISLTLSIISFNIIYTYYPIIALDRNVSNYSVGVILSASEIGILVFGPLITFLTNNAGLKFVFVWCLFISSGSTFLFSFVYFDKLNATHIAMSFILRLFQGGSYFGIQTNSIILASILYPNDLSKSMGFMEIASGFGYMLGPVIGGSIYQLYGFVIPTLLLSTINFFMFLVMFIFTTETEKGSENKVDKNSSKYIFEILKMPNIYFGMLCLVVNGISYSFIDMFLALYLQMEFSLTKSESGSALMAPPLWYITSGPIVGYIIDKKKISSILMISGAIINTIIFFFLGPAIELQIIRINLWQTIACASLSGLTSILLFVPTMTYFLEATRKNGLGENEKVNSILSGLLQIGGGIGGITGPIIGGILLQNYTFRQACIFFSICNLITFITMILCNKSSRCLERK